MALLLDTHAFLWWVQDDPKLTRRARRAIADEDCALSLASCWEMAIKVRLGKLEVPVPVERFIQKQVELNGFSLLPISLEHASRVADLPFHHRDPFDRLLVAQAMVEAVPLVTCDPKISPYPITRIW